MQAYAFDLDGTLADLDTAERRALDEAYRLGFGAEPPEGLFPAFKAAVHALEAEAPPRPGAGDVFRQGRLPAGLARIGIDPPQGSLEEMVRIYREITAGEISLFSDAVDVLGRLRAKPLFLLTNGPSDIQRRKLRTLGIEDIFQGIVISGEVGARKPDALFFDAARRKGVPLGETVFFGDNPVADIKGGRAAGMCTAWVNRPGAAYPGGLPRPDVAGRDLRACLDALAGVSR